MKKIPLIVIAFSVLMWGSAKFHLFEGVRPCHASEGLYEERLDRGLFNTDPYSYVLMEKAHRERERARELLEAARKYSPDLPAVYFALARESLSPSVEGIFESIDYFRQGLKAHERNFWWTYSLAGVMFISLILSFVLALFVITAVRFPAEYRLLLHDIGEDKRKTLFAVVPILLSPFGFFAFICGVLFLIGLYFRRKRDKAVVYAALLALLLSPVLTEKMDAFLSPPSPELRAAVAVNEGRDNTYALMTLRGSGDFVPAFSYALALKREGYSTDALSLYKDLIQRRPDAIVYTNLGNTYYAIKDLEAAKESYKTALGMKPHPSAYYNLSQVYREVFDFARGDEFFLAAAKLDNESVSRYASISGSSPNRFVIDETLPMTVLWNYAEGKGKISGSSSVIVALTMIIAFFLLDRKVKVRAHRCKRCGAVFCSGCSRTLIRGEMCLKCYTFLIRAEELDSRERIGRLLSIYQSQTKRRQIVKLLSYATAGAGQIYAGRILTGLLFLWPFLFSLLLLVFTLIPVIGPSPFTHSWLSPFAAALMCFVYLLSFLHTRKGINRGWL